MNAKQLFDNFAGFLNHHVADLGAVSAALQGLLAAVPVNAETRASINTAIQRVTDSAANVARALDDMGKLEAPELHIAESDIAKALTDEQGRAVLSQIIADYLAAHPQVGAIAPQQDAAAATTAVKGAVMQGSDRSGPQQMGEGQTTAHVPQDGTNREEAAPAGDPATGDAGNVSERAA